MNAQGSARVAARRRLPSIPATPGAAVVQCIGRAAAVLAAPGRLSDERAHAARKALKQARAGLRVLRGTVATGEFRSEDQTLRECGRAIAPLRDAHVLLRRFEWLRERYARDHAAGDLEPLALALRRALAEARRATDGRQGAARTTARALDRAAQRLRVLADAQGDGERAAHVKGLRRIYRTGRKALHRASKAGPGPVLHRWRKQVKYLADGIKSLGRPATAREHALEQQARRIGEWLGEEHDLAMLAAAVERHGDALDAGVREAAMSLLAERRRKLCRRSLRLGAELYDAKPRRAVRAPLAGKGATAPLEPRLSR